MKFNVKIKTPNMMNTHKQVDKNIGLELKRVYKIGQSYAKSIAPYDTGKLASSIYYDVEKTTKGYYAYLISLPIGGVPYNVYQEYGTGLSGALNLIHPRAKSTLKDTYTKMSYNINYLGFGSQPFMFPTANLIAKLFNAELIIERELNK